MNYMLIKNSIANDKYRDGYYQLAKDTFRLSFENWYNSGYFDGKHVPYTLFDGDKAVANISVNFMDVVFEGHRKKYVQLGTVMTDKEYRGKGLQKYIFIEIMKDLQGKADAIFLFANKTVLEFYPKLGFVKDEEYAFAKTINGTLGNLRQLDMTNPDDVAMVKKYYEKGNPFSDMTVVDGFGLEMFYLGGPYSECVYYMSEYDAVVILEKDKNSLTVLDIFCTADKDMDDILSALCHGETVINLGFTPKSTDGWGVELLNDEDTTLFIHEDGENVFTGKQLLFPLIAHT